MHYRAFITINKERIDAWSKNSKKKFSPGDVCKYAEQLLIDEGFCNQGMFGSGPSDWFEIGGRWKGELIKESLDQKDVSLFYNTIKNSFGYNVGYDDKRVTKLSQSIFGFDYYKKRDAYPNAAIVTQKIYDIFLKQYEGESNDGEQFWDMDGDDVNEDFVDNKWIVVVDYHN